jgi:TolB-like protein
VIAAWTFATRRSSMHATVTSRVRIAVALFDNETGIADYDRLAQTLTDATVARLASDPARLAVIGNAPILRQPRPLRNVSAIGRTLDVGHVILGQVQQIQGHVRVTTHLIRTGDQTHLWAHRFEPTAAESATLDRDVSEAVANAVIARLYDDALTNR